MRLEKGYRAFARELTPETTPVEAGLTFACALRGPGDFLGRAAVEARRAAGPARRVVSFVADDPQAYLWGGELVLRDGAPVGQVTSAAFGATVGASVGLALVGPRGSHAGDGGGARADRCRAGRWQVDLAGTLVPVRVSLRAPFDPDGARIGRT